jgi:hypothetical protein
VLGYLNAAPAELLPVDLQCVFLRVFPYVLPFQFTPPIRRATDLSSKYANMGGPSIEIIEKLNGNRALEALPIDLTNKYAINRHINPIPHHLNKGKY